MTAFYLLTKLNYDFTTQKIKKNNVPYYSIIAQLNGFLSRSENLKLYEFCCNL